MKTLRNTSIIVLVAISLGFVNVFAEMRVAKINKSKTTVKVVSIPEKARVESDDALRTILSDILRSSSIYETGKVNIVFKVNDRKQIEVMNVFGSNPALVSSVKYTINKTIIIVPDATEGKYMVSALF